VHLSPGIGDVPLDLFDGCTIDHRPAGDTLLRAGADLPLRDPAGEL